MNSLFDKCIEEILGNSEEEEERKIDLRKKYKGRFQLIFTITVGSIGKMKAAFDNHRNHQRPHVHIKINKATTVSVAVDTGEILHKSDVKTKLKKEIKVWVLERNHCLEFIYKHIDKCKRKEDFEEIIEEMRKSL